MKNKDFKIWHASFVIPYLITFILGLLKDYNIMIYKFKPFAGIAGFAIPLTVYLLTKNRKTIGKMIVGNIRIKGNPLMKAAKISTLVIIVYYLLSFITGMLMFLGFYSWPTGYEIYSRVHSLALFVVPIAVMIHVLCRLSLKKQSRRLVR